MGEQVLVANNDHIANVMGEDGIPEGFTRCGPELLGALCNKAFFMERDQAETDFDHKQLIPYVLFMNSFAVFNYYRSPTGGEGRLHGKRSVGVGGHVNPPDNIHYSELGVAEMALTVGMLREIEEEVTAFHKDGPTSLRFVGVINTEEVEVGKVHLGLVYLCQLRDMNLTPRKEGNMYEHGYHAVKHLQQEHYEDLEPWSKIAVDAILSGQLP